MVKAIQITRTSKTKYEIMRLKEFVIEKDERQVFVKMLDDFLPIAMKILNLDKLPKFIFVHKLQHDIQPSFGEYRPDQKSLTVALTNRHPNDILRTIAHELTHYKQDTLDQLGPDSGRTGSPTENQAHVMAGIIMRNFNKQYPDYLKVKPIQ